MRFNEWWMNRQPEHPYSDALLEEAWMAAIKECISVCEKTETYSDRHGGDICANELRNILKSV